MVNEKTCYNSNTRMNSGKRHDPGSHGPSSYKIHDSDLVFKSMNLKDSECFIDIGCGSGDYSIHASEIIGYSGAIYSIDLCEDYLLHINETAEKKGLKNIYTKVADITESIPLEQNIADICLISTVLHILDIRKMGEKIFSEISRILKQDGRLFIIECKKENTLYGPPEYLRISSEELEDILSDYNFKKKVYIDLGNNYMIEFFKV